MNKNNIVIEFSNLIESSSVPFGTIPIKQNFRISDFIEMHELCRAPSGKIFAHHSKATSKKISITSPFNNSRAWADLVAPAFLYFHDVIFLRCAAVLSIRSNSLVLVMGASGSGKTTSLNYLIEKGQFLPLADDHLGLVVKDEGLSVFTPIWDEQYRRNNYVENIKSINIAMLNRKLQLSPNHSHFMAFALSQILCSTLDAVLTSKVINFLDFITSNASFLYLSELRPPKVLNDLSALYRKLGA